MGLQAILLAIGLVAQIVVVVSISPEEIAVQRLRELTQEVTELRTQTHFLHAKADAEVEEVAKSKDKEDEMITRNEGLTNAMHRLQNENQKARDAIEKSSQALAEQVRTDEEKEAQMTREANFIRDENAQLHKEEQELSANRSALMRNMHAEQEKERALKEDLHRLEEADAKYQDRTALLEQLNKVSERDAVLKQEVQMLKTENGKLLRSEERNQAWITKLRAAVEKEREKRFQADDTVSQHEQGMRNIEASRREEKAQLVAKALAAEQEVSSQSSLVASLQAENDKLKAQLRAANVEYGDLQERHNGLTASPVKVAQHIKTHFEVETDADDELQRLHYELRGRLKNPTA